jgi:ubiquinone/menaquinone biosynthesis C-methylase UbiE
MLQKARNKNPNIEYKLGKAENIELPSNSMDGVTAFLTIHHWTNLDEGFREISRILKPGGRFVIFHSTPEQMKGYWLNDYFPKMLKDSMELMHTSEVVELAATKAGIELIQTENYAVTNELQDLFLQGGKYRPEMYFRPEIRKGISSFAAVANLEEVESGLDQLKKDIDSGEINEVIENYENDLDDYLFMIFQKK